mmetsp:Transcript_22802/g.65745  ORF Transcript_22802/g.65745 Transcript_22802/m.65745 type:complete len:269 (+) Transcript_22802:1974-2780(+)
MGPCATEDHQQHRGQPARELVGQAGGHPKLLDGKAVREGGHVVVVVQDEVGGLVEADGGEGFAGGEGGGVGPNVDVGPDAEAPHGGDLAVEEEPVGGQEGEGDGGGEAAGRGGVGRQGMATIGVGDVVGGSGRAWCAAGIGRQERGAQIAAVRAWIGVVLDVVVEKAEGYRRRLSVGPPPPPSTHCTAARTAEEMARLGAGTVLGLQIVIAIILFLLVLFHGRSHVVAILFFLCGGLATRRKDVAAVRFKWVRHVLAASSLLTFQLAQ